MRRLIYVIVLIRYKQFLFRLGSNLCQRLKIKKMNVGFTASIQQYYSNAEQPPIMSKQGGIHWLCLYTVLRQGEWKVSNNIKLVINHKGMEIIPEYINRFCKILAFNANF